MEMRKALHRGSFRPPVRTALSAMITLGACSALLTTGLGFVSASPASAAQATKLVFAAQPHKTAVDGKSVATFVVLVEDGINARATTNLSDSISSSCVLGGTTVATASDGVATFSSLAIVSVGLCTLTATDTSTPMAAVTSRSVTVRASTSWHRMHRMRRVK